MTMAQATGKTARTDADAEMRRAKGIYAWLWLSPVLTLVTLGILVPVGYGFGISLFPTNYLDRSSYQASALLTGVFAVLGSGLWHLLLLIWALDRKSEFVRWHGRQALLLAGARTAVALGLAIIVATGSGGSTGFFGVVLLFALWFFGTLWAQGQAAAGDCSLMRWAGHGAALPRRAPTAAPVLLAGAATHLPALYQQALELENHDRYAEADRLFRQLLVSTASPEIKRDAADALPLPGEAGSSETADILVAMLHFSLDPLRRQAALAALEQAGLVESL